MTDIGTGYGPGSWSQAYGINATGVIVGIRSESLIAPVNAFVWRNGGFRDLGTLGGTTAFGVNSRAQDINDLNQIVGTARTANGAIHAFLFRHGVMQDLGTLVGGSGSASEAFGINNLRQVVGHSITGSGGSRTRFSMAKRCDARPGHVGWR
ncbi:MAG: hypothetical protein HC853_12925 [Anaerolineae bacterium]|nr:hypothetical protein [Anaerolineae bacterium]